jgi:hypothetical protein
MRYCEFECRVFVFFEPILIHILLKIFNYIESAQQKVYSFFENTVLPTTWRPFSINRVYGLSIIVFSILVQ